MEYTADAISVPHIPSSPDAAEVSDAESDPDEVKRVLEKEPWVWTNTLLQKLESVVNGAIKKGSAYDSSTKDLDPRGDSLCASWVSSDVCLTLLLYADRSGNLDSSRPARKRCGSET